MFQKPMLTFNDDVAMQTLALAKKMLPCGNQHSVLEIASSVYL